MNTKKREIVSYLFFVTFILAAIFDLFFSKAFIISVHNSKLMDFLGDILVSVKGGNPEDRSLEFFISLGRILNTIFLLVLLPLVLWLGYISGRPKFIFLIASRIKSMFREKDHPINLAVFRIVIFAYILFSFFDLKSIVFFSNVPKEFIVPPIGLGPILEVIPINEQLVKILSLLFMIFCFTGMIGLFTRFSSSMALLLGLYLLGIPQFFGKVHHYHHLLWFLGVIAASRHAGDMLSVDAIFKAIKRADQGNIAPPEPSRQYAIPLRFVYLLMGYIYFFPGMWKLFRGGIDWIVTDNLKYLMYAKWFQLDMQPITLVEQFPNFIKVGGFLTILFEITFIFLILFPRVRSLAAIGGLLFHNVMNLFLRIPFESLQICYVAFVNWNKIFSIIGDRLYKQKLYVLYDGNCKICRRTITSLRAFDIFGQILYLNATDHRSFEKYNLSWINKNEVLLDMHAVLGNKVFKGYDSYRQIAKRIPILIPILPFMYLWPINKIGPKIYRRVADSRTCSIAYRKVDADINVSNFVQDKKVSLVMVIGLFLLSVNYIAGSIGLYSSWPFAVYPKFDYTQSKEVTTLSVVLINKDGKDENYDLEVLHEYVDPSRLDSLLSTVVQNDSKKFDYSGALYKLLSSVSPEIDKTKAIKFYRDTYSLQGGDQTARLESHDLIYQISQ